MKAKILIFSLLILVFSGADVRAAERLRIVSLTPGATEVLFALELEEEIAGLTTSCDFPEGAKAKEKVGQYGHPNIEKILHLRPNLILSIGLEGTPELEELKRLKLNLVSFNPKTLDELVATIAEVGKLTDREKEAAFLAEKMRDKIREVRQKSEMIAESERPGVFVEIWDDPLITLGPGSFIDDLIKIAGGSNIAHDLPQSYSQISAEVVIKRNPDWIILSHRLSPDADAVSVLAQRVGWKDIKAVKRGQVIADINPDILLRPSPRLVEGLEKLYERIQQK